MSNPQPTSAMQWTRERAALLALVCLLAGAAGGWFIAAMRSPASISSAPRSSPVAAASQPPVSSPAQLAPAQLKQMADSQAAPLLQKLASDPASPGLLTSIGNLYYDAQQYPVAVDYYARALRLHPSDASVRTDMGTAFWYMGNSDRAIAEFNRALAYVPDNPNTLFNLGLVRWKGKNDPQGARTAWERLLATAPAYPQKSQVEQMLAELNTHN
jgi:Tfp pilus assembly protein PilF